ncbi:MAG: preprotein translocase subunit SecE [bacterium]|nr:preprotein translocase subunit SecE [bacterium]
MQPISFLRDTWAELKLVRWPNRATTIKLTVIVIAISVLVGAYVGGLDYLFTSILKLVVK